MPEMIEVQIDSVRVHLMTPQRLVDHQGIDHEPDPAELTDQLVRGAGGGLFQVRGQPPSDLAIPLRDQPQSIAVFAGRSDIGREGLGQPVSRGNLEARRIEVGVIGCSGEPYAGHALAVAGTGWPDLNGHGSILTMGGP